MIFVGVGVLGWVEGFRAKQRRACSTVLDNPVIGRIHSL
jgi:hypothetical protein